MKNVVKVGSQKLLPRCISFPNFFIRSLLSSKIEKILKIGLWHKKSTYVCKCLIFNERETRLEPATLSLEG